MRSLSAARRLPRWFPLRNALLRRRTRKLMDQDQVNGFPETSIPQIEVPEKAEVVYIVNSVTNASGESKTGTDF